MERFRAQRKLFTTMITAIVALCGCNRSTPTPYGAGYNPSRISRSIPPLSPSFKLYSFVGDVVQWSNSNGWGPPPKGRLEKKVHLTGDSVSSETDTYYSGVGFKALDPDAGSAEPEQMFITFDYAAELRGNNPWKCEIANGPDKGSYDLKQAELILSRWGIDRTK